MSGRHWTPDEEQLLRDAVCEGATAAEIGAEVGRSVSAVHEKMRRMGLRARNPGGPVRHGRRAEVVRLLSCGLSVNRVAAHLGLAMPSVLELVRKLVAGGVLVRLGTRTGNVRYVPGPDWSRP